MRGALGDLFATALLVGLATMDTADMWRLLARTCQYGAEGLGRAGIYAEARAAVLTAELG